MKRKILHGSDVDSINLCYSRPYFGAFALYRRPRSIRQQRRYMNGRNLARSLLHHPHRHCHSTNALRKASSKKVIFIGGAEIHKRLARTSPRPLYREIPSLASSSSSPRSTTTTTIFSPLVRTGVDGNDVLALVADDELRQKGRCDSVSTPSPAHHADFYETENFNSTAE
jgi:hypothetical protein